MTETLTVKSAGPAVTVQDMGWHGYFAQGLTRGGAADGLALEEGAALLGQNPSLAGIEMSGLGGVFTTSTDTTIALTGARMTANIDGAPIPWNASHALPAQATLTIGGAIEGTYGYLSIAGGIDCPMIMGARASHLKSGIGRTLSAGDSLPIKARIADTSGRYLDPDPRFGGGDIRIVPSFQTEQFSADTLERFTQADFRRDAKGNRQGVRLASDGDGFFLEGGLSIVSEVIAEGDIQMTGDGAPYILLCECQTTGGYPRIGTVLPCDLPRVVQAPVGAPLRFTFVTLEEARRIEQQDRAARKALPSRLSALVRDPRDVADLLSYQLVSGVVSAQDDEI